jgi:hypothetical protein
MGKKDVKPSRSVVVSQYAATSFQVRETTRVEPDVRLERYLRNTLVVLTALVALLMVINQGKAGLSATGTAERASMASGIEAVTAGSTRPVETRPDADSGGYLGTVKSSPLSGTLLRNGPVVPRITSRSTPINC